MDRPNGDPETAPGEVAKTCRCCRAARTQAPVRHRLVGATEDADFGYRHIGTVLPRSSITLDDKTAPAGFLELPDRELLLQEVCAGTAGITGAWHKLGWEAEEPVELYEDPQRKRGPRPDHDITRRASEAPLASGR